MVLDCSEWSRIKVIHGAAWMLQSAHSGPGYVVSRRRAALPTPGTRFAILSRLITNAPPGNVVTYRDGNPLNLTIANLHILSKAEFAAKSALIRAHTRVA
jgi:hypothetical protein